MKPHLSKYKWVIFTIILITAFGGFHWWSDPVKSLRRHHSELVDLATWDFPLKSKASSYSDKSVNRFQTEVENMNSDIQLIRLLGNPEYNKYYDYDDLITFYEEISNMWNEASGFLDSVHDNEKELAPISMRIAVLKGKLFWAKIDRKTADSDF